MKTIVHIELSDLDRNDLAKRIDREDTSRLVTRKEVTELVLALIQQEIEDGRNQEEERGDERHVDPDEPEIKLEGGVPEAHTPAFIPSRGDEDYLTQPKDPGIAAACSRILDDTALIEQFAWDTIERNRKK